MTELPQPLTPADCDLRNFPEMPFNIVRLRRSKAWLVAKRMPEIAFFMLNLWTASWHEVPAASLEDDDDVLADCAMCDPKRWKKIKAEVMRGWVKCADGRLYHSVVAEMANRSWFKKVVYAWKKECDRIRKANKLREAKDLPPFDFPPEPTNPSPEFREDDAGIPSETSLKGEGEEREREKRGRREGEGFKNVRPLADDPAQPGLLPPGTGDASSPPGKPRAKKHHGTVEDHEAARWIFGKVQVVNATAKEPNWDTWANDIRLMRESDSRTHKEICEAFQWAHRDAFWCDKILSPSKLREKWDTLTAQRNTRVGHLPLGQDLDAQRRANTEEAKRRLGIGTKTEVLDAQ